MSLTLSWVNHNEGYKTRVYKSAELFDEKTIPETPVATLEAGVTTWVDTDVKLGDTNYYMIEFFNETEVLRSRIHEKKVELESHNMRGVKTFGSTNGSDVTDWFSYVASVYPAATTGSNAFDLIVEEVTGNNPYNSVLFHEFNLQGRVLYMSATPLVLDVKAMIEKGFFFGNQRRNLPAGTPVEKYPESKLFVWRGHKFRVMLPSALPEDSAITTVNLNFANMVDTKGRATNKEVLEKGGLAQLLATTSGSAKHLLYLNSSVSARMPADNRLSSSPIGTCTATGAVDGNGDPLFHVLTNIPLNNSNITSSTFGVTSKLSSRLLIEYLGV